MPLTPYVTAAEFQAHPTYLDLDDLRSGFPDPAAQTAELTNLLLMSSAWADRQCNQPLAAHQLTVRWPLKARDGGLTVPAKDTPIISVSSFSYGIQPQSPTVVADPQPWIGEDQTMLFSGLALAAGVRFYTATTYIACWVATTVATAAAAGATSLTVADPTGIVPGGTYRLWEPGVEEFVTVASSYLPAAVTIPATQTAIPLAAPTVHDHEVGFSFSGMPEDMRLAVVNYTISQLMRPDTAAEDSYPDTTMAAGTRQADPRKDGSGLVAEAVRLLLPFKRVR